MRKDDIGSWTATELRQSFRDDQLDIPTSGLAAGNVQANLMVVPAQYAFDFLLFCQRNPKAFPIVEVLEAGRFEPDCAPGADLRTDLSRFQIWRNGQAIEEVKNLRAHWRSDFVSFLTGCSFSFEAALLDEGIPVRHMECGLNVPMYESKHSCVPAGVFCGPLIVSMRPIPADRVARCVEICAGLPHAHGAPIHVGDPAALGIDNLSKPDKGDSVPIHEGEVPVFWPCGATLHTVAAKSRLPFCITHAAGYMFITDIANHEFDASGVRRPRVHKRGARG